MERRPDSWVGVTAAIAELLAGPESEVSEWLRQALEERYGVQDPSELRPRPRAVAFQKYLGVLYQLREESGKGDLAFRLGLRRVICGAFARYFGGVCVDGPAWRLGPDEPDRPRRDEVAASADFT